ncbi:MAG TPA: UDP-N-acetylmuramate--L-alanine ligase, partial [Tepidisphaeraceae bacterium]|nr:UDP-N-acetylmuramate--L-alanine ligase [Tepidisphaeraceae bacterium]
MNESRTDSRQPSSARRPGSRFRGKRVHFIGIGGCGMSGLARMLLDAGAIVTGSDSKPNEAVFDLIRRGAKVSRDQLGESLSLQVDLVVRTAAVPTNNLEYAAACKLGLPQVKYSELLGIAMADSLGVAVAGTHGKSTTTAMIGFALAECGLDPSIVVGGTVPQIGGSCRSGGGEVFVAEACEYDRSFHRLHPTIALITNIEEDHLDCYHDIHEIVASFHAFARLVPPTGRIIAGNYDRVREALAGVRAPIEWVGSNGLENWSSHAIGIENGCYVGEISHLGQPIGTLKLSVAGRHNLQNATMALAACVACGADAAKAIEALSRFTGVDRRMSVVGSCNGATIVDDYGHHPTEIRATLTALRERFSPRRLICVFQPHQHSRTRFLLDDFATSFAEADTTIVPDIYFVRDSEAERQRVSSNDLVERIRQAGQKARHLPDFSAI